MRLRRAMRVRVAADAELSDDHKRRLQRLAVLNRNRAEIESRGIVVSARVLREAVRRDIEALFNTERFEVRAAAVATASARQELLPSLADFPEVRRSVVNYGVPSFSGRTACDFDREELAQARSVRCSAYSSPGFGKARPR